MAELQASCAPSLEASAVTDRAEKRAHPSAAEQDGEPQRKKSKRRVRYAMLLAYQGKNYCGMQIQKDAPTIEGHLLKAMHEYKLITDEEMAKPYLFFFQRAARTDRAVSAVRQVCSMMLGIDEELPKTGPEQLNELLPKDIRVMGIRRATRTFNSQKDCDGRTYSYTLPTYAFAKLDELTTDAYRISDETVKEIDQVLQLFVGTHNFYNYTARREFKDKSCFRYIIKFECGERFVAKNGLTGDDVEFMTITIKGQSFMLHQIRKMIGMVIAISRGLAYKSDIQRSFEGVRMDVPKAPGLGLLLEKLHYGHYDKKFAKTHESLDDWGEEIEGGVRRAREELIVSEIIRQEIATQSMMCWLSDLVKHDFIVNPQDHAPPARSPLAMAAALADKVKKDGESSAQTGTADNKESADSGVETEAERGTANGTEVTAEQEKGPAPEGGATQSESASERKTNKPDSPREIEAERPEPAEEMRG